jgi:hypothetical protein
MRWVRQLAALVAGLDTRLDARDATRGQVAA